MCRRTVGRVTLNLSVVLLFEGGAVMSTRGGPSGRPHLLADADDRVEIDE